MRRLSFAFPCTIVLAITLFLVSCSKDGEQGPAGPAGPAGGAGPQGPAGPKGDPGTANVVYSNWLDVTFTRQVPRPGDTSYSATINAPKLVDSILNRGEIKVYVNFGTTAAPQVFALPLSGELGFVVLPFFEVGKINLISDLDAGTETVTGGQKTFQYRYVLIPGTIPGRTNQKIDWNNYNQVKTYLGLKD